MMSSRIVAAVAETRISEVDQRLLINGFEAISPGGLSRQGMDDRPVKPAYRIVGRS